MRRHSKTALLLFLALISNALAAAQNFPDQRARELLSQSIAAMGGLDLLRSVQTLSYESAQHTFFHRVEVSESLPQIIVYENNEVVLQPKNYALKEKTNWRWTDSAAQRNSQLTITPQGGYTESDNKKTPITANGFYKSVDILAANPIAALLAACEATDLTLGTSSKESDVVTFHQSVYGQPVKTTLAINKETHVLQWIEIEHSYSQDVFASFWGRTVKRAVLSGWLLDTSGLHFPTKWQISTNERIDGQESLFNLKINPDVAASDFAIPEELKNSFDALHLSEEDLALRNRGDGKHLDIADGVVMFPGKAGAYNSLVVKQDKGIVVIEAPYTKSNSDYIIANARKAFHGVPITIYVLDSNMALMQRFLAAQVSEGQIHKSDIKLRTVAARTELGTGANRISLIPFRGTASARMVAVYFPVLKLLYCSDLYLPQTWGGQYYTEHLAEIRDLITREHIDVLQVSGVSMVPHDWKELSALIPVPKN